jgi:hypothetical protein
MIRTSLRTTLAIAGTLLAVAIAAPAEAATFTITIPDSGTCNGGWQTTGSATNPTITCAGTPAPAGAPTCTTVGPDQTVSPGTSVTLLTNCSPGSTYSWTQGTVAGPQVSVGPTYVTPLLSATTTYWVTVSANGASTTYPTTVTVGATPAPPPPVATSSCSGYSVVNVGDLSFNGARIATDGVSGSAVVVGRIVLPNPLPPGWAGNVASIAVFEYSDPQYSKKMYLSQSPCDFTAVWPAYGEGNSMNVRTTFQNAMFNAVNMNPGDVWYLTVKNERSNGQPSCKQGSSCNFALTLSAPSAD